MAAGCVVFFETTGFNSWQGSPALFRSAGDVVSGNRIEAIAGYFFFEVERWARADPAALLEAALVRPSRRTLDAAVAALAEVVLFESTCAKVLPAAVFDV